MNKVKNIYTLSNGVGNYRGGKKIKSIIKGKSIELSNPVPIGGEEYDNDRGKMDTHKADKVEPIIENDEVIGIIHHCQCGKSTEIRFDY